jgi:hypothetical protein
MNRPCTARCEEGQTIGSASFTGAWRTEAIAFRLKEYRIPAAGPVAWVATEGVGQGRAEIAQGFLHAV